MGAADRDVRHEWVVLVHGLWMGGWCMAWLSRSLQRCGYRCLSFSYRSVRRTPAENARALAAFIDRLGPVAKVHLVAHSLGGIVLLHLFDGQPRLVSGRVVMLGVPANGSAAARRLARCRWTRWVLGRSLVRGLVGGAPSWKGEAELGVVAGTVNLGMGRLIGGIERPSDGAVSVAETRIGAASAMQLVGTNHAGLLLSAAVVRACCAFLGRGSFTE
jgi:pimeloyl-ACP methyl ester carboxylesterase